MDERQKARYMITQQVETASFVRPTFLKIFLEVILNLCDRLIYCLFNSIPSFTCTVFSPFSSGNIADPQQPTRPLAGLSGVWHNTSAGIVHDASCDQIIQVPRESRDALLSQPDAINPEGILMPMARTRVFGLPVARPLQRTSYLWTGTRQRGTYPWWPDADLSRARPRDRQTL